MHLHYLGFWMVEFTIHNLIFSLDDRFRIPGGDRLQDRFQHQHHQLLLHAWIYFEAAMQC